jgi:hypothetical protein
MKAKIGAVSYDNVGAQNWGPFAGNEAHFNPVLRLTETAYKPRETGSSNAYHYGPYYRFNLNTVRWLSSFVNTKYGENAL